MRTKSLVSQLGLAVGAAMSMFSGIAPAWALPAFPGAEGFGAIATGGRGGQVVKVTNLNQGGPGSLQAALDMPGPRIIVFTVSGVIPGDHYVTQGDVTIAGQTAPGGGITIAGRLFGDYDDSVSNMIVRFMRVRPVYDGSAGNQFDGMQFSLNSALIFDHMSVSWGVDETFDLYEADDVTVQYCTIEESQVGGHPDGAHNYGMIQGPDGHRITVHHNLFAHHRNRNPAIANGPADVRNNVAYNVRHGFVHHNSPSGKFNIVGNTYIQGPNDSLYPFYFDEPAAAGTKYYLADNYIDDPGDYVGIVQNPWQEPFLHPTFANMAKDESYRSATEHDFTQSVPGYIPVTTQPSTEARDLVVAKAGAFPRDVVTRRIVDELEARGGSWGVHMPDDLMEGLSPASPPPDGDDDGMADAWETAHGLDPSDGSDHTTVMPSGYTAIEDYINGLAAVLTGEDPGGGGGAGGSGSGSGGSGAGGSGNGTGGDGAGSGNGGAPGGNGGSGGAPGGNGSNGGNGGAPGGNGGAPAPGSGAGDGQEGGCAIGLSPVGSAASGGLAAMAAALLLARRRARRASR